MDTILYFYRKRGLEKPETEPVGLKSYLLVRVGLDVGEDTWFRERLGFPEKWEFGAEDEALPENEKAASGIKRLFSKGQRQKEKLRRQKEALQREAMQKEVFLAEQEARILRAETGVKRLVAEILEYSGTESRIFCVYEEKIRKVLQGKEILPTLWQQSLVWKEFTDYTSRFWVEQLLPRAELPQFVILGTAACIPEILGKCASHMKSLHWILAEAENTEELQTFVEDFYAESGLAISVQTFSHAGEFRRLRLVCGLPSNILDFTEEPHVMDISGVARGSVWLDFQSIEEKQRWIQARGTEIYYFSMKEIWKTAQRRCIAPILP